MATAIKVSVSLVHLVAIGKTLKFTFPVFAIGTILTTFVAIFLDITVSEGLLEHSQM